MKKILALIMAMAMVLALAACGSSANNEVAEEPVAVEEAAPAAEEAAEEPAAEVTEAVVEEEAAEEEPEGGFTEIPIWEDEEVGFLNVNGVFFQPVPMSGGNENFEDFDLHFEADVSALKNNLGYGVGDWVPYMTVDYELTGKNTGEVISGTFMPMNADDGNHYGANIKMPTADTYSVKLTFHSPEESTYLIHLDDETGPGGNFGDYQWPLVLELPDVWDYVPMEW